eukprot:366130-Chlamydomonas_euryale.AAC.19
MNNLDNATSNSCTRLGPTPVHAASKRHATCPSGLTSRAVPGGAPIAHQLRSTSYTMRDVLLVAGPSLQALLIVQAACPNPSTTTACSEAALAAAKSTAWCTVFQATRSSCVQSSRRSHLGACSATKSSVESCVGGTPSAPKSSRGNCSLRDSPEANIASSCACRQAPTGPRDAAASERPSAKAPCNRGLLMACGSGAGHNRVHPVGAEHPDRWGPNPGLEGCGLPASNSTHSGQCFLQQPAFALPASSTVATTQCAWPMAYFMILA